MTNTVTNNYVSETVKVMTESITTSTNECSTNVTTGQFNIINGGNSDNCKVTINADVSTTVDMSCCASTNVQNNVNNNFEQFGDQMAESVNQQF